MYHPGEIRTPGLELMLLLVRAVIFGGVIFIITGVLSVIGVPGFITGGLAGLAAFAVLVGGSFFEVIDFRCPYCDHTARVLKDFGSYRCPSCGGASHIYRGVVTKL